MREYGWIPIKEFRELPLSTFWSLYGTISERKKLEQKEYDKLKHKNKRMK